MVHMCREGAAQAAADEAALAAPSPPPEPTTNASSPSCSRRTAPSAQQAAKKATKKAPAANASPRRKSKSATVSSKEHVVLSDAGPSLQPAAEVGSVLVGSDATDAAAPEAANDIPAELSEALAAWQEFEVQAKGLILGRPQQDNMVQLLSSQVEGKQAEQVTMEVSLHLHLTSGLLFCATTVAARHGGAAVACYLLVHTPGLGPGKLHLVQHCMCYVEFSN